MTAIDRAALVEAARDELAGWPIGSGYYGTKVDVSEAREMAEAALPVIVAAALKPIRELHVSRECGVLAGYCRSCDYAEPCPTVRLCDEVEAAAKGGA